jgi:hypothetical protein
MTNSTNPQQNASAGGTAVGPLYTSAIALAVLGAVLDTADLSLLLPGTVYLFLAAGLWAVALLGEAAQWLSRREPPAPAPQAAPAPTIVLPPRPKGEMDLLLEQLVRDNAAAKTQMEHDARIWPVLRGEATLGTATGTTRTLRREDLDRVPSLLRAALERHAHAVPALGAADPALGGGRDRYSVRLA